MENILELRRDVLEAQLKLDLAHGDIKAACWTNNGIAELADFEAEDRAFIAAVDRIVQPSLKIDGGPLKRLISAIRKCCSR